MAALGRLVGSIPRSKRIPDPWGQLAAAHVRVQRQLSSKAPPATDVKAQLLRLGELRQRVGAENGTNAKLALLAEYSDLRQVLELVYDPSLNFGVKSASMLDSLAAESDGAAAPESLAELLSTMAARRPGGPSARGMCAHFLAAHGVVENGRADPALWDEFARLLDRNMKAGFGPRLLHAVPWKGEAAAVKKAVKKTPDVPPTAIPPFACALGNSTSPPFKQMFDPGPRVTPSRWFASRKLDGVRCLALVDVRLPEKGRPSIEDVKFVSRKCNEFTSLARLKEQLAHLADVEGLRELAADAPLYTVPGGVVTRLVLDGEVCVMRRMTSDEMSATTRAGPGDTGALADELWDDIGLVEDFNRTVSQIKRVDQPIEHPRFYLFDALPWGEVLAGKGRRAFSERVPAFQGLAAGLAKVLEARGVLSPLVRALQQTEVTSADEVSGMVERAAREGWEGLMFRADKPYKGKRSNDVLKYKQWQDAEYTVESVDTSRQRLSVNGVYGEYEACSNVWIRHEGVPVSVGSGFSTAQRLRYGRHPEEIIGKQITVEYFGESTNARRGESEKSLRFPRIKMVWEEGKRGV
ncbi:hypothetical protein Q8F55_003437 [Vanrija albida]|uniref:DNA ligase OB-like domain-containing protein n=1 Tax=Vanrija albida TaxID=181172 RepID=A0ABR3Q3Y7_9TREE